MPASAARGSMICQLTLHTGDQLTVSDEVTQA